MSPYADLKPNAVRLPERDGKASSSAFGTALFEHIARSLPSAGGRVAGSGELADALGRVAVWRKDYHEVMRAATAVDDPAHGDDIARSGLSFVASMTTTRGVPLSEIGIDGAEMAAPGRGGRSSNVGETVRGGGARVAELEIPTSAGVLRGPALALRLDEWVHTGMITQVAVRKLRELQREPELLDLRGHRFALLGAGAELSPARFLLAHGAEVYAVIRDTSPRLARLTADAELLAGTLHLPPAGAGDLSADPAAVARWLVGVRPHVVVDTLYAPGVKFLLAAAGADTVVRILAEQGEALFAWYGSPTDAYPLGHNRERAGGVWREPGRNVSVGRAALSGGIFDGIVDLQGPNYLIAKRIARWRATELGARGKAVSYNVAPMSRTQSVLGTPVLRDVYRGLERLGAPPFEAPTAAAVMAALAVWDWQASAAGQLGVRPDLLVHPDFLTRSAVPSGLWSQDARLEDLFAHAARIGKDSPEVGSGA